MPHLRISPRHLGQMLLADFCPRCFFYQVQMNFKPPFDRSMPGLMFHMDSFEKRIVLAHLEEHGAMPKWLKKLDCTSAVDFPAKMTMEFPKHDIELVGMPDAVFRKSNNNLYLIDWKTAMYKGEADPFMPIYQTQLLGYAVLLEGNGIGKVEDAALVYFQNGLKNYESKPLDLMTAQGFDVPFSALIHEVDIDRSGLDPLLKQIQAIARLTAPPEGRERCRDCARLQSLMDGEFFRRNLEDATRVRDGYGRHLSRGFERSRQRARNAWEEDGDSESLLRLDSEALDQVPASWDC